MTLRAGIILLSAVVAALAIASLTHSSGHSPSTQIVHPTAAVRTPQTPAPAAATHHQPAAKPMPAATRMSNPTQEAVTNPAGPSLARMVGQQMMVKFDGTSPDADLLRRIHDGQVGGVILYSENVTSQAQVTALDAELQRAARSGHNPPLLISTDQEGGQVKRLPWAAPSLAPPTIGADGTAVAEQQGRQTGADLRAAGVNVDLGPVTDVAHSRDVFIWKQERAFGMSDSTVTPAVAAFSQGMEDAGVAPTAKHFPGVGSAPTDTDYALQKLTLTREDVVPYQTLISEQIPLIMVGTAVYENLDPNHPAALSHDVVTGLLRDHLGFQGVTMSDDLERPTDQTTGEAAVLAAKAGINIILVSSTEGAGASTYQALLDAARSGAIPLPTVADSSGRVLALKKQYASS